MADSLLTWQKRKVALLDAMDRYYNMLESTGTEPETFWAQFRMLFGWTDPKPEIAVLQTLVSCLKNFTGQFFDYFYNGFAQSTLAHSTMYPRNYVLWLILDQAAHDLSVIQAAASQRLLGCDKTRKALRKANTLIQHALAPAIDSGLLPNPDICVIPYLHKSANIRLIPYANVVLVGVPYTVIDDSQAGTQRDFLAIAHEVGHYVYWRAKLGQMTIIEALRQKFDESNPSPPQWIREWSEEVFADVYGCLVAGPTLALDFQDWMNGKSKKTFTDDDKAHPVPALRPLIYTRVLGKKEGMHDWKTSLDDLWSRRLDDRLGLNVENLEQDMMTYSGSSTGVSLAGVQNELNILVDLIYNRIYAKLDPHLPTWWTGGIDTVAVPQGEALETLPDLYEAFEALYTHFESRLPDLAESECESLNCNAATNWQDWLREHTEKGAVYTPTPDDVNWGWTLRADGWTTKGPNKVLVP